MQNTFRLLSLAALGFGLSLPACFVTDELVVVPPAPIIIEVTQTPDGAWINQDTVKFEIKCSQAGEEIDCSSDFECYWSEDGTSELYTHSLDRCSMDYELPSEGVEYTFLIADVRSRPQTGEPTLPDVRLPGPRILQKDMNSPKIGLDSKLKSESGKTFADFGFVNPLDLLALNHSDAGSPVTQFSFCPNATDEGECQDVWKDCATDLNCTLPNPGTGKLGRIIIAPGSDYKRRLGIQATDSDGNTSVKFQNYYLNVRNQIAASLYATCAISRMRRDTVRCWGDSRFGETGTGSQSLDKSGAEGEITAADLGFGNDGVICELLGGKRGFCALGNSTGAECPKVERHDQNFMLSCWGAEVKDGNVVVLEQPMEVPLQEDMAWRSMSLAESHYCAINEVGKLYCWGQNEMGQLGSGGFESKSMPNVIPHPSDHRWRMVSTSSDFTCAADSQNQIWCWGGSWGAIPLEVANQKNRVCALVSNDTHFFLHTSSTYNCLGKSEVTAILRGDTQGKVISSGSLTRLRARGKNFCREWEEEWDCIGDNEWRHLGTLDSLQSVKLPAPKETETEVELYILTSPSAAEDYRDLTLSYHHWCAIQIEDNSNRFVCAGFDLYGQVSGPTKQRSVFTEPEQLGKKTWSMVSAGQDHTCAIDTDNALYCWGRDFLGQMGTKRAEITNLHGPRALTCGDTPQRKFKFVEAGALATMAITTQNEICVWTEDPYLAARAGEALPMGSDGIFMLSSSQFEELTGDFQEISMGRKHACVRSSENELYCWGRNLSEQIPGASTDVVPMKAVIPQIASNIRSISTGRNHSCVTADQGTGTSSIACFGENDFGQLGTTTATVSRHNFISAQENRIASGQNYNCAVPFDRASVTCWGTMTYHPGYSWIPTNSNPLTDDQVFHRDGSSSIAFDSIIDFSTGDNHTCFILADTSTVAGSVSCVGDNSHGQLGLIDMMFKLSPNDDLTQSVSSKPLTSVSAGGAHTCAIDEESRLYCWGSNAYGQLGQMRYAGVSNPIELQSNP